MFGHGGIFKTEKVAQSFLAAALTVLFVLCKLQVKVAHGVSQYWRDI